MEGGATTTPGSRAASPRPIPAHSSSSYSSSSTSSSSSSASASTLQPPTVPPRPGHNRASSSTNSLSSTGTTMSSSPSSSYGNLSYAPRQSPYRSPHGSIGSRSGAAAAAGIAAVAGSPYSPAPAPAQAPKFKATQSGFMSHSTFFASAQQSQQQLPSTVPLTRSPSPGAATALPPTTTSTTTTTTLLEAPLLDPPSATTATTTATATASGSLSDDDFQLEMEQLIGKCESLGLPRSSPGVALLRKLAEATDGEWRALANLVAEGQATLLLPVSATSSSRPTDSDAAPPTFEPSLSFAHDHVLLRPGIAPRQRGQLRGEVMTLSGLRGTIEPVTAPESTPQSAGDEGPSSEDQDEEVTPKKLVIRTFISRGDNAWMAQMWSSDGRRQLSSSLPPLPRVCCSEYPCPAYTLMTSAQIEIPSPPMRPPRSRASSSSSLALAHFGLSPPQPPQGHRPSASTSFATLFGGGHREKKASLAVPDSPAGGRELQPVSGTLTPKQTPLEQRSPESTPARKLSIWLIDRPCRKSRAIRRMAHSVQARLQVQLEREREREAGIESRAAATAADMVSDFAGLFYPRIEPVTSAATSIGDATSGETGGVARMPFPRSPTTPTASSPKSLTFPSTAVFQPGPLSTAPPDEVSSRYQDLCSNVEHAVSHTEGAEANGHEERVFPYLEVVERLLTTELYNRLFAPPQAADQTADRVLSSRVAAFNILGMDWEHLGLRLPASVESGEDTATTIQGPLNHRDGLRRLLDECSQALQKLGDPTCFSPKDKLDVLVRVHRIIVEGLAKLPRIDLRSEDSSAESTDEIKSGRGSNTSSADLILPILIRLIVSANPDRLVSHLLFIQRYRCEALMKAGGESAYCLINFQAAVQFIENAKPAELGLDDAVKTFDPNDASSEGEAGRQRSAAIEMLKTVRQEQIDSAGGPGGALALPVGGRMKALTGVVNSSFSVLGRVIGSGATAGMEAWDRSAKNMDGVRTLDDIRNMLGAGIARGTATSSNLVGLIRDKDREGNVGEDEREGGPSLGAAGKASSRGGRTRTQSLRSVGSASRLRTQSQPQSQTQSGTTATDYSRAEEVAKDVPEAAIGAKPSLSDRLANLNWRFGMSSPGYTPQPLSGAGAAAPERELPGPPPPTKLQSQVAAPGAGSSLGLEPNHFGAPARAGQSVTHNFPVATTPTETQLPASLQSPYPALSSPPTSDRPLHVVLATSGSVASIKAPLIVESLLRHSNVRVQVVATKSSLHFYDKAEIVEIGKRAAAGRGHESEPQAPYTVASLAEENLAASRGIAPSSASPPLPLAHVWTDEDEWASWQRVGDAILHIELRRWADIVLVAPCGANLLAKIASGICDDLLTSFLRALCPSLTRTPALLYPAMNTLMFLHPLTAQHLEVARSLLGFEVVGPIEKKLACGDMGVGAMSEWEGIVGDVVLRFGLVEGAEAAAPAEVAEDGKGDTSAHVDKGRS